MDRHVDVPVSCSVLPLPAGRVTVTGVAVPLQPLVGQMVTDAWHGAEVEHGCAVPGDVLLLHCPDPRQTRVLVMSFTRVSPLAQHCPPIEFPAQMGSELEHGVYVCARIGAGHRLRARSTATTTNNG